MKMQGWDVIVGGRVVNTAFYDSDMDAETVRRSLIDHDGYDEGITIRQAKTGLTDVQALREVITWTAYFNANDSVPGETEKDRAKYLRNIRRRVRAIIARVEAEGDITRLVG